MNTVKTIEVCAAVIRNDDKCLICSRPANSKWHGYWEFPGGKIEPGETVAQCVCRELKEELNLKVRALDTIWILEHEYPEYRVRVHFIRCMILPIFISLRNGGAYFFGSKVESCIDFPFHYIQDFHYMKEA